MLDDEQLEQAIVATPAPRVRKEDIEQRIKETTYHKIGERVTICEITLDNGFSVRGESACVNPENYVKEIGDRIAFDNAFRQLWPLFGFLLAETQFKADCWWECQKHIVGAEEKPATE